MNYINTKGPKLNSTKRSMKTKCEEFICLICGRKGNHTIIVSSCQSYVSSSGTPLAKFLYKVIGEEPCYSVSEYMCQQCFLLLDRLDTYQARAAEINHHILTRYKDTKFGYFGSRQRISELIASSLSNLKSFKNGTTLNVSDELSVTVFHEALPRGKIRSLNRATSNISNLIEGSTDSSHVNNNYLKRKRTPPIRLNKSIKKQKNGTLPSLIINNGINKDINNVINESDSYSNINGLDATLAVNSNVNGDIANSERNSNVSELTPGDQDETPNNNRTPDSGSEHSDREDSDNSSSSTASISSRKNKSSKGSDSNTRSSSSSSSSSTSNNSSCSSNSSSSSSSSSSDETSDEEEIDAATVKAKSRRIKKEAEEPPVKKEEQRSDPVDDALEHPIKEEANQSVRQVKLEGEEQSPKTASEEIYRRNQEMESFDPHIAEAVFMQNSFASNLLQSFLSTSLWMNSSEPVSQNIINNLSKQQQSNIHLLQKRNCLGDATVDSLSNAAVSIKDKKKRLELKNTGQSYINTKGKLVEAKRIWPQDCSRCPLRCNGRLTEEMRLVIFADYWGLADYDLQREYLASHMEREERLGPSGYTRTVVLYYLTYEKKRIQVCRQFFLKTLDVSEKASRIVLEKKLKGELGAEVSQASALHSEEVHNNDGSPD